MATVLISRLMIAVRAAATAAILLMPGPLQAALGPDDLPGLNEEIVITDSVEYLIGAGQTGTWAGTFTVQAGGSLTITNLGTLDIPFGAVSSSSATFSLVNAATMDVGNFNMQSYAGTFNVSNESTLTSGNWNIAHSGAGTLTLSNSGTANLTNLNSSTYGGQTSFVNTGTLNINNFNVLDQNDKTTINNSASLNVNNINMTANGAMGFVELANTGTVQSGTVNINANYGGTVNIDGQFGSATIDSLNGQANGSSHGKSSAINILNGYMDIAHENFNVHNAQINIQNNGYDAIGTMNVTCTGTTGVLNLQNNGTFILETGNFNAYTGGQINLANNGWLEGNEMWILAQSADEASRVALFNTATLQLSQLSLTSTGAATVGFQNNGVLDADKVSISTLFGGKTGVNTLFGQFNAEDIDFDVDYSVDGLPQIAVLAYGHLKADGTLTIEGSAVDKAFLDSSEAAFFVYDDQGKTYLVAFNGSNPPAVVPEPLTLIGGVLGCAAVAWRRRRWIRKHLRGAGTK
ncbi:MAG: hypothetical protein ABFD92_18995 [Planctomycetaceae bacterium]|nr:hypothetical protein [Planctomycetaceae bacterium]